ncbi:hypothetical protein C8R42DRAFT_724635 [Lentinula raphanica]|nr:hypothetical protein C8R42DRAFT_724635 [Lentinula raphanica]
MLSSAHASSVYNLTLQEPFLGSSLGSVMKVTAADEPWKLHAHLESHLQAFWASVIPNGTCQLPPPSPISSVASSAASSTNVLPIFIRDAGDGEQLSDPTGDFYDKMSSRSAPSSFDASAYSVPGESHSITFFNTFEHRFTTSMYNPSLQSRNLLIDFNESPASTTAQSVQPTRTFPPSSFTPLTPLTPKTPVIPATPASSASTSATPKTPKTPWTNYSNASYASFKSKRSVESTSTMSNGIARMSESGKKQYELQMRANKATGALLFKIVLKVFRSPEESKLGYGGDPWIVCGLGLYLYASKLYLTALRLGRPSEVWRFISTTAISRPSRVLDVRMRIGGDEICEVSDEVATAFGYSRLLAASSSVSS